MPQEHDPRESPDERLSQDRPETSDDNESVEGGGGSNRAIEEEQREQQNLPPRGETQESGDA
jgi:hypothetical protein